MALIANTGSVNRKTGLFLKIVQIKHRKYFNKWKEKACG